MAPHECARTGGVFHSGTLPAGNGFATRNVFPRKAGDEAMELPLLDLVDLHALFAAPLIDRLDAVICCAIRNRSTRERGRALSPSTSPG